jgi:hypothetical protein
VVNIADESWGTTANFTTSAPVTVFPPTNLTLTDLGGNTVTANWTLGVNSTYTLIRISRSEEPSTVDDGEWLYYDSGTSANITGWPVSIQPLYVSVWGVAADNITYSETYTTALMGGDTMVFLVLGLMAVGLLIAMTATKQMMLGFPTAILWFILGGYSYTQSSTPWSDWQYYLFFASMGIGIFSMFAAYALRTKKEEAQEGDLYFDEGGDKDVKFVDEGSDSEKDVGEDKPRRVSRDIRDRAERRRARWD